MRPGAMALALLAAPLNVHVLKAVEHEELSLVDLRRSVGHPPVTTMRSYLRTLTDLGVLERQRGPDFPAAVSYGITPSGERLLAVGDALQHWLRSAPDGPASLGSLAAKSAIKALVDGWSSGLVRALAARPFSLTELNRLISHINYPTLERRLTAMRLVGLVEAKKSGAVRGTPYSTAEWLRLAVSPLTAATGWERRCASSQSTPIGRIDVEATFLLAVPLIRLSPNISGTCRLAAELGGGAEPEYAGVRVTIEEGKPISCVTRLSGEADAWTAGTPLSWFRWARGYGDSEIQVGGDTDLALALAEAFREALIPADRV